jgi:AcrR family transcriptional regulator
MSARPGGSRKRTNAASSNRTVSMEDEVNRLKRKLILEVASRLFYERGYSGTSMEAIAEELGATKPFLYYYFQSKADILAEVCGTTVESVADIAESTLRSDDTCTERLSRLVRSLTLAVIEGRVDLSVYFREEKDLPKEAFRKLKQNRRRFEKAVAALLAAGAASEEFAVTDFAFTARAIAGMTTWLFTWYRAHGPNTPEQIADQMEGLVMNMVRARKAGPRITEALALSASQ